MVSEEFRVIPGYCGYAVTRSGLIKSIERDLILKQYMLDSYLIVDAFRDSLTETLPVHRAVALAWVVNPQPDRYTVVNHRDGNRQNNWFENLEWTDYSGNNYHAINTGLRPDNIECRVRDFYTKEVYLFSSIAQAAEFMGMRKDTSLHQLYPKMFGKLVANRYEFRYKDDQTPWFYSDRSELVSPSRYMVRVTDQDGRTKEVYSNRSMLKDYQLYDSPEGKSIPALARFAQTLHPSLKFEVRDSYDEVRHRTRRNTKLSPTTPIRAIRDGQVIDFKSLTKCAEHFNVDRSVITTRLDNEKQHDGWTFLSLPL